MTQKILLIEDEPHTALLEISFLQKHGFVVSWANNSKKALQELELDIKPNLILLDIDLSEGIDGIDLAKTILSQCEIPIVFLSSHTDLQTIQKTEEVESYGYLLKGSPGAILLSAVKKALQFSTLHKTFRLQTKQLTQKINYFYQALYQSKYGFLAFDSSGKILDVNSAYCQMSGYERSECIGLSIYDLDLMFTHLELKKKFKEGSFFKTKHKKKNGSSLELEMNASYQPDYEDCYFCLLSDITLENQKFNDLEESKNILKTILNSLHPFIFWKDLDGTYLGSNQNLSESIEKKSSLESVNFSGANLQWSKEQQKTFKEDDAFVIKNKVSKLNFISSIQAKDGKDIWLNISRIPLHKSDGSLFGILEVYENITESKLQQDSKDQALKEKEVLLQEVHHRMKNNFTSIESLLFLQSETTTNLETKKNLLDAIGRIRSIRIVYDSLLLDTNYKTISLKLYLETLLNSVIKIFNNFPKVQLHTSIEDLHVPAKLALNLGIMLNELITNSMKYAFSHQLNPEINLIVKKELDELILILQDNGKGLGESFSLEQEDGLGLGLVKLLSQQMNGNFHIETLNGTRSTIKVKT